MDNGPPGKPDLLRKETAVTLPDRSTLDGVRYLAVCSLRRRAICLSLIALGAALITVPFATRRSMDAHAARLRLNGVEALADVTDRIQHRSGKNIPREVTINLTYTHAGLVYREEIRCEKGCRTNGQSVRIWLDREDPRDFVTEWGDLDDPFAPWEWFAYVGAAMAATGIIVLIDPHPRRRRMSDA